ncbi:MAG: hypothetical protein H0T79_09885 [Deltaproteobacteria bacterium]|nr:hypothetical protein [Deltaproteobacteria bacterium]
MISKTRFLAAFLSLSVLSAGVVGCSSDEGTERWAATENTNVKIDWDKVNEAYKAAEGPEDLEKRINEIYEGDEVISVHVQDTDAKTQVVTGFFDKNTSGAIDEGEKIFTIKRDITGEGTAQYQTQGHGAYYGYHSPFMSIASGMMMGMMVSSMFRPNYMPMYTTPYATSAGRVSTLSSTRSSYRAANPSKFQRSQSGRSYGSKPSTSRPSSGGRMRGGGGFGLHRAGRTVRPQRLAV